MPDPFRRQPNGGPFRGPTPRNRPPAPPRAPPPGGTAGIAQQTPAAQLGTVIFAPGFGRGASRPSAKRTGRSFPVAGGGRKRTGKRTNRRALGRKKAKKAKFVKGSAAAKRHMAKLRRMQKRRR